MTPPSPLPPFPEDDNLPVQFHFEDVDFELPDTGRLRQWIERVAAGQRCTIVAVNFIFCSDDYLHDLNVQYLNHDTLTDIITFPYLSPPDIEGDIFISADRVRENALSYGVSFDEELRRVMIHGVLHLCGQSDKTAEEKKHMTDKENEALRIWQDGN